MAKTILNFHFDYLNPSLTDLWNTSRNVILPSALTGFESECSYFKGNTLFSMSCLCSFDTLPLLSVRGLCESSLIAHNSVSEVKLFTPKQVPGGDSVMMLGRWTTRNEYNQTSNQWTMTEAKHNVTAVSESPKVSYVLGKHKWTIFGDPYECSLGKPYTTMLKLTGCDPEDEFTCDDGQCISMERRCDQVTGSEPNCRDKSDEKGCQQAPAGSRIFNPGISGTGFCKIPGSRDFSGRD